MELYYEQNVVNNRMDESNKKTKTLNIIKTCCWVLGVMIIVSSAMMISFFWVFLLLAVPFFVGAFLLSRINKRYNTEYDYVLDDEKLIVSEIYFRSRRKLKHKIRLRTIESVGVFDSDGYNRVKNTVSKRITAIVNYEDEKSILYIVYNSDKGKKMIFLEPDRGFLSTLRRALPSVSIFDKSVSDLDKYLLKKEADIYKKPTNTPDEQLNKESAVADRGETSAPKENDNNDNNDDTVNTDETEGGEDK